MPAEDTERHSSYVCVFVKLLDTAHQNSESRGSVGLSSWRNSALWRSWASVMKVCSWHWTDCATGFCLSNFRANYFQQICACGHEVSLFFYRGAISTAFCSVPNTSSKFSLNWSCFVQHKWTFDRCDLRLTVYDRHWKSCQAGIRGAPEKLILDQGEASRAKSQDLEFQPANWNSAGSNRKILWNILCSACITAGCFYTSEYNQIPQIVQVVCKEVDKKTVVVYALSLSLPCCRDSSDTGNPFPLSVWGTWEE